MKRFFFLPIWLIVCLLAGCRNGTDTGNRSTVKNVKTVFPALLSDVTVRTFPGVVKAANEMNLAFKTAGQISRIAVKEGDYVREGDVIAELDKKDYMLQLEATQVQYDQLKTELVRLEELYKRNSISANDFEKAKAGLEALSVLLQANKNTIEYTTLRSPVAGYIQSVNFSRSEMVNAGTAVVTLVDVSSVKVETELPASLYLRMDDFNKFACRTNLAGNDEIALKFTGINRKSNSSQLHKMVFVPESSKSRLAPGMNVEILISINERSRGTAYTLPAKTVFSEDGKTYVWIVRNSEARNDEARNGNAQIGNARNGEVKKCEIVTDGINPNGHLIILSGLSDRDEVVYAGLRALQENDRVNIIPEATATNRGGLL